MTNSLQCTRDARGVVTLTLSRPNTRNAFDEAMIDDLHNAVTSLDADPSVRVIILAAVGPCFCAGADIAWMQRAANQDEATNLADARRFAKMMAALSTCRKPIIARVQGAAFGGGVGLICAADIVIASTNARFAISEAKFGILPAVIGPYLVHAVGKRQALRLALNANIIDANEALAIGLLHKIVESHALDQAIELTVTELLGNGPLALAEIKCLFNQLSTAPIDEHTRELTARTISRVRATPEARLGFDAFIHKHPPIWQVPAVPNNTETTPRTESTQ